MSPVNILPSLLPSDADGDLSIIVSTGPSWRLNPAAWSIDQSYGHGAARLDVRAVFKNPLDEAIGQIAAAVNGIGQAVGPNGPIQTQLGTLLTNTDLVYQQVSSSGPLQKQLINAKSQLDQLAIELNTANQEVANVGAALNEIRKIFPST